MERCPRGHMLATVTTDDGEVLVHLFESDAEECEQLDSAAGPRRRD